MKSLTGKISLVTGASRGAGRGIALALGDAGATVYVTGRSINRDKTTENLPGTIHETALLVTERGGKGIPVPCDHTKDADVAILFKHIRETHGRLDVLVNNVWGGYEKYDGAAFDAPFWELPLRHWEGMFESGVRAHLVTSRHAAELMIPTKSGLIVNTTAWDRDRYLGNLIYDVAKSAINRMAFGMARELKPHGIVAVALAPGFMRTERVMAAHTEHPFDLNQTESPEYGGRAVVALAADPDIMHKTGQTLRVGDLAREYKFTDTDGRQVLAFEIPE